MSPGPFLIIWHSRTGTSEQLALAAHQGAGANTRLLRAEEVEPEDILAAGGYLFCCPENLASMSGEMKEMFDRCYYPVLGRIEGRPYATVIAAGSDGEGAQRQIDRIATGWRLKRVTDQWIVNTEAQEAEAILAPKTVEPEALDRARDLGTALAEGIAQGIF
ncbi:flavodoxin [Erythrobacter sp. HI0019]|jgi:NAD(P)H-dependent FMN reductase|uniref:flavodoxin family protein n=1 Tax=unclassified Erythrobacter TaxID=2633097 RepID=UPI0007B83126|nr:MULTISPECIES: NAD(P)H-dependent oxidoreductase [unclassified Erythrobacter]KZX91047.1 flavodoxin [Erythrobacter sp. HI0019]KZY01287.1 flavodoxin [Erythrobacter sp. HI0028]